MCKFVHPLALDLTVVQNCTLGYKIHIFFFFFQGLLRQLKTYVHTNFQVTATITTTITNTIASILVTSMANVCTILYTIYKRPVVCNFLVLEGFSVKNYEKRYILKKFLPKNHKFVNFDYAKLRNAKLSNSVRN